MKSQSPSITNIIKLAIPLIMANCLIPVLGLINTAIVGHLATATVLAAVALGVTIFDFFLGAFNFLRMSTTGLIAQQLHHKNQVVLILVRALLLSLIISVLLLCLQWPLKQLVFSIIHTTPAIARQISIYFSITIWSVPFQLMLYVILGWLIAIKHTKRALVLTLWTLIITVPTAWVLVYGYHWRAAGVACAGLFASICTCLLGLYWMWKEYRYTLPTITLKSVCQWQAIKPLLAFNGNVFIRTLLLLSCFSFFTLQSSHLGSIILAANAVLMDVQILSAYFLDGIANITESFIGEAVGIKSALGKVLKNTAIASLLVALMLTLTWWLFGHALISALTNISQVADTAKHYLIWIIVLPLIGVGSYWLDGVFVGATKSAAMRNTMVIAAACYFGLWYVMGSWGNNALWLALCVFLLARALGQLTLLLIWLRRNGWQSL